MCNAERQAARQRLHDLLTIVRGMPAQKDQLARLLEEAEALERAISAFHLEGIRFRIYNVDRLVQHPPVPLPADAATIVADVRKHLEAAGFPPRAHQAPGEFRPPARTGLWALGFCFWGGLIHLRWRG